MPLPSPLSCCLLSQEQLSTGARTSSNYPGGLCVVPSNWPDAVLEKGRHHFWAGKAVIFISSKGSKRSLLPLERLELTEKLPLWAPRSLVQRCKGSQTYLWSESRHSFMSLWRSIVAALKLTYLNFKPYSLRRGGASSAYRNGATLDELVSRGRWQQVSTARIYLDTGLQALSSLTLPEASQPLVRRAALTFQTVSQQRGAWKGG